MAKIYWAGQSCFQISVSTSKDHSADIVIDPFDEKIGLKLPSLSADIVLVTHEHGDHNNVEGVKGTPFVVNGPGESKLANIGISLPGRDESPVAPVFVDGQKFVTLKGDKIAEEFQLIVDEYVKNTYAKV